MECLAGVGLVAGAVGKNAFEYNRDNFQGDREQRRRAAVKTMSWRIDQAKLWREDVRDLISLTEYKMRMYLIINVLLCGMDIFLYTEGSLPESTPHWLMAGSTISIGSSFNFFILSIWLAMYAAISAQSYEVRLVTQMVRLPIPTWEELEASRTYGSEFEKLEARQMFRVPYIMGWQERLARSGEPPFASISSASNGGVGGPEATVGAVDPWGLEQSANTPELGSGFGVDVARLRHVKLARQAAIQWSTYDGFARICMSIGVQQLMLALIYYLLGYLFVEVNSSGAAVSGVIGFTIIAEMILVKDTSLPRGSRRLAQFLLGIGPVCATLAAAHWESEVNNHYKYWVVVAFVAHGLYFALIAFYCRVRELSNGAWLPMAFRSVLYIDAFCWTRLDEEETFASGGGVGENVERDAPSISRPAAQSVRYNDRGLPIPVQVQDWAPPSSQDMRDVPGAPDTSGRGGSSNAFYGQESFLQDESKNMEKEVWSDRLGPGDLPWRVFMVALFVLVAVWLFAALYSLHGLLTGFSWDIGNTRDLDAARHNKSVDPQPWNPQPWDPQPWNPQPWDAQPWDAQPWDTDPETIWKEKDTPAWVRDTTSANLLSASSLGSPQQIMMEWPHLKVRPSRLSCDADGRMLVLSDRVALFSASVLLQTNESKEATDMGKLYAFPKQFACPSLLGEGLDDVALSCNSSQSNVCNLFALHKHGRHITACALQTSAEKTHSSFIPTDAMDSAQISDSWFENSQLASNTLDGNARSGIEKPLSVSVNPSCKESFGSRKLACTVVSTSQGRVVQLGQRSNGKNLIPAAVLHEEPPHTQRAISAKSVRAVSRRYLGVLNALGHSIRMLDMSKGGLVAGTIDMRLKSPAISFCAGGGNLFVLTEGSLPQLWKMPIPREFVEAPEQY